MCYVKNSLAPPSSFPEFRGSVCFGSGFHQVVGITTLFLQLSEAQSLIWELREFLEHSAKQWFSGSVVSAEPFTRFSSCCRASTVQVVSAWTSDSWYRLRTPYFPACLQSFGRTFLESDLFSRNAKCDCFQKMNINYVGKAPFHLNVEMSWGKKLFCWEATLLLLPEDQPAGLNLKCDGNWCKQLHFPLEDAVLIHSSAEGRAVGSWAYSSLSYRVRSFLVALILSKLTLWNKLLLHVSWEAYWACTHTSYFRATDVHIPSKAYVVVNHVWHKGWGTFTGFC